jgi:uncharacterized protein (DUF433 family)
MNAVTSLKASTVTCTLGVMSGMPCVSGTRVLAETIVAYLREGANDSEILEDYPYLPSDGVDAVRRWAEASGISTERGAEGGFEFWQAHNEGLLHRDRVFDR